VQLLVEAALGVKLTLCEDVKLCEGDWDGVVLSGTMISWSTLQKDVARGTDTLMLDL